MKVVTGHRRRMTTDFDRRGGFGEADSCLAALADVPVDAEQASHFDHLLIELDILSGDVGPACSSMASTNDELLDRLEGAVDRIAEHSVGGISLVLLLDSAPNAEESARCWVY